MAVSKVGLGWPIAERDFDTIGDWDQARGGSSEFERGICAGLVLTANTFINGPYPAGAELIGLVEYDGETNHQDLALCDAGLTIGTANVTVNDLWLDGPTNFFQSARIANNGTSDSFFDNCYISAKPTNTTGVIISANSGINRGFRRCVIDFNGRSVGYSTGWGTNVTFDGNIFKNYTTTAVRSISGGGGDRHFINNIAVEGTGSDLNITQFATFENNATLDSTGQYTGYGKAEFVDFDGGDYRIKSTSDLHALGIGAFFEEGGGAGEEEFGGISSVNSTVNSNVVGSFINEVPINQEVSGVLNSSLLINSVLQSIVENIQELKTTTSIDTEVNYNLNSSFENIQNYSGTTSSELVVSYNLITNTVNNQTLTNQFSVSNLVSYSIIASSVNTVGNDQNYQGVLNTHNVIDSSLNSFITNEQVRSSTFSVDTKVSSNLLSVITNSQELLTNTTVESIVSKQFIGSFVNQQEYKGTLNKDSIVSGNLVGSFTNILGNFQDYTGTLSVGAVVTSNAITSSIVEQSFTNTFNITSIVYGSFIGSFENTSEQLFTGVCSVNSFVNGTLIGSVVNELTTGWNEPITLFAEPEEIKEIALTFDQLGRPLVFYRIHEDVLKLYWYDPVLEQNVTVQVATGTSPNAGFDFPQRTGEAFSDAMLFYVRGRKIFMRIQRDRFNIEYECSVEADQLKILSSGLRIDNRYQVVYQFLADSYVRPIGPPLDINSRPMYKLEYGQALKTTIKPIVNKYDFNIGFGIKNIGNPNGIRMLFSQGSQRSNLSFVAHSLFPSSLAMFYYTNSVDAFMLILKINNREHYYSLNGPLQDGVYEVAVTATSCTVYRNGVVLISGVVVMAAEQGPSDLGNLMFGGFIVDGMSNTYTLPAAIYNCWVDTNGQRIDWALETVKEPVQISVPTGSDITIHNHKIENWISAVP